MNPNVKPFLLLYIIYLSKSVQTPSKWILEGKDPKETF